MHHLFKLFFTFVAILSFTANGWSQALPALERPSPMPTILSWQNPEGQKETISNYRGKVVLLNLWATWCGPCVYELPQLNDLQKRYKSAGLEVITLSTDDTPEKIKEFFKRYEIDQLKAYTSSNKMIPQSLNVQSLPATFLINKDGIIIAAKEGIADWMGSAVQGQVEAELRRVQKHLKPSEMPAIIDAIPYSGVRH